MLVFGASQEYQECLERLLAKEPNRRVDGVSGAKARGLERLACMRSSGAKARCCSCLL